MDTIVPPEARGTYQDDFLHYSLRESKVSKSEKRTDKQADHPFTIREPGDAWPSTYVPQDIIAYGRTLIPDGVRGPRGRERAYSEPLRTVLPTSTPIYQRRMPETLVAPWATGERAGRRSSIGGGRVTAGDHTQTPTNHQLTNERTPDRPDHTLDRPLPGANGRAYRQERRNRRRFLEER